MKLLDRLLSWFAPPPVIRYPNTEFVPVPGQLCRDQNGLEATVLDIQPDWMSYRTPDGRQHIRSRRGFCKQFKPVDQAAASR